MDDGTLRSDPFYASFVFAVEAARSDWARTVRDDISYRNATARLHAAVNLLTVGAQHAAVLAATRAATASMLHGAPSGREEAVATVTALLLPLPKTQPAMGINHYHAWLCDFMESLGYDPDGIDWDDQDELLGELLYESLWSRPGSDVA